MIVWMLPVERPRSLLMTAIVVCRSYSMILLTAAMFSSVCDVDGRPVRGSFSSDSLPSLNDDAHLATVRYEGQ